jgi:hypothetical protein
MVEAKASVVATQTRKRSHRSEHYRNKSAPPVLGHQDEKTREVSVVNTVRDEEIRRRAYEIYLERGEQSGRELDDWLQAELEFGRVLVSRAQRA